MNDRFTQTPILAHKAGLPIYLDHHATTPVDRRVADVAMRLMLEEFGNANGTENLHGERAAAAMAKAQLQIARLIGAAAEDVHFTSGSTEAIQLAVAHAIAARKAPLRLAMTRMEHKAVIDTALRAQQLGLAKVSWIAADDKGRVVWQDFERVLKEGADLVCAMAANNEVGTIYPIEQMANAAHSCSADILVDATQALGRMPLDVSTGGYDYVVISAHKIYGPKGIGALVSPKFDRAATYGLIGAHAPTPNVSGAAALGVACEIMEREGAEEARRLLVLRDLLQERLTSMAGIVANGDPDHRLPHNLHIAVAGAPNDVVLSRLRGKVSLSTGSACNSGAQEPSHVLRAMGFSDDKIETCLRIGLGRFNSVEDIERAAAFLTEAILDVRIAMSGA